MKPSHTLKNDPALQKQHLEGINRMRQERNRYYVTNIVLLIVVVVLAIAVMVLSQMQTVIPVIAVMDANGHVVTQKVVEKETIAANGSFLQNQVYEFIQACNTFDSDFRQHYADLCHIRSTPEVAAQYDAETATDNTSNPYYVMGKNAKRYPRITSITALDDHTYQVEFASFTVKQGIEVKTEYYKAILNYIITSRPIAVENRWENPLGFAVTSYRKDQELDNRLPNKP